MNTLLIKFFHQAPTSGKKVAPETLIPEAAKRGFLVHPDCCTQDVYDFIMSEDFNPNSTFYKTWEDVTSKDRFELFIDQILHYCTTYGTDYQADTYIPNGEPLKLNYKTYTMIEPVSDDLMFINCMNVLQAGAALAETTLNAIVDYVVEMVKTKNMPIAIESIKNRDAMCLVSTKLGMYPVSGDAIVRVLYYEVFGKATPVKGRMQLMQLHGRRGAKYRDPLIDINVDLTKLTDPQKVELSKVFLRNRKFLLGLKTNSANNHVINQIRRLAKKNHVPFHKGFWEDFTNLSEQEVMGQLDRQVANLENPFKIVRLIQMIRLRRLQNQSQSMRMYAIRNGKLWSDNNSIAPFAGWWAEVCEKLTIRLTEILRTKMESIHNGLPVYVKFPKNLNLVCPVSEKLFLGNIPFGSSFDLKDKDNYFGVYWRNEWGTRDFDLWFLNENDQRLGWQSDYYDRGYGEKQNIVFSGDMTNAAPEATEMFYVSATCPNGLITLNRYNGSPDSKFRLFFGQERIQNLTKNYMVDPSGIEVSEMGSSTAQQQLLGAILDNRAYLGVFDMAGGKVTTSNLKFLQSYMDRLRSYIPLKEVLLAAGFQEYTDEVAERGDNLDIDLTDLKKDTILNLFSVNY